ncbi:MAG: protoheme IX farnesyltransferase [Planctomycetes bacterium]|nr:protoheme IX farnesyltransferase [Planctomycetota bacterium]
MILEQTLRAREPARILDRARDYLELAKVRITILSTVTCAVGYWLAVERVSWEMLPVLAGIFLLASAASVLNQIQERGLDARMERTSRRPLPEGRVSPGEAWTLFAATAAGGGAFLYICGLPALGFGLAALVWYNGVYTPLKRVTPFAVVPGAVIGALPPLAGWVAAGRGPLEGPILALAFFMFVWQIPHFWLILLYVGKDYEKAGLPSMHGIFSAEQLSRITFVWILATAIAGLAMPVFGMGRGILLQALLLLSAGWMAWGALKLLRPPAGPKPFRGVFLRINLYALAVLAALTLDKLVPIR